MKIFNDNFYKFFFGFIGIVLISLFIIFIAGNLENSQTVEIVDECSDGKMSC
jgi:hypothetical protein